MILYTWMILIMPRDSSSIHSTIYIHPAGKLLSRETIGLNYRIIWYTLIHLEWSFKNITPTPPQPTSQARMWPRSWQKTENVETSEMTLHAASYLLHTCMVCWERVSIDAKSKCCIFNSTCCRLIKTIFDSIMVFLSKTLPVQGFQANTYR